MQNKFYSIVMLTSLLMLFNFGCVSTKDVHIYQNKSSGSFIVIKPDSTFILKNQSAHLGNMQYISVGKIIDCKGNIILSSTDLGLNNLNLLPNSPNHQKLISIDSVDIKVYNQNNILLSNYVIEFIDSLGNVLLGEMIFDVPPKIFIPDSIINSISHFRIYKMNMTGIGFNTKLIPISLNSYTMQSYIIQVPDVFMEANDWKYINDTINLNFQRIIWQHGVKYNRILNHKQRRYLLEQSILIEKEAKYIPYLAELSKH